MADPAVASKRFRTHNVDASVNYFKFAVGAAGAVGTLSQGNGAAVTSVAKAATGRYTVQLALPYPSALIDVKPSLAVVAVTSLLQRAAYKAGSYSPSAGTFEVICSAPTDDTHATTQIAADPVSGSEYTVEYVYLD